jgi:flap endonuclease-1
MGIRSLTSLIKQKSPNSIETTALYTLSGKKVAIDTSIFLYKSLSNYRYNGDYLRNKEGKVVSHIVGIFYKTIQYLALGITPIYIFDGKPPIEKQSVINDRTKKASESKLLSEQSLTQEEKQKHEKGSIRVKKHHVDDIKYLFKLMGISYIHPDGEAEAYASELCRKGYVDYVVSEDMDTLVYGCPKMIRGCLDKTIKRKDVVSIIDLEVILKDFNMNMKEFTDMCILCGCDYCPSIPKVGTIRSFTYIQNYKTIENLVESKKCPNIPQEFIDKYDQSRNLFNTFKDKVNIEEVPLTSSSCDMDKLNEFLLNECAISEKRVQNALKKMNLSTEQFV